MSALRGALALLLALAGGTAGAGVVVEPWPLPTGSVHAAQPSLAATADGRVLLSWIERGTETHRLRFAAADANGGFAEARTIAEGDDWFVNWADFPSLLALENGDLVGFVLQKTAAMPYAYDLRLTRSTDGGLRWSTPRTVHDDGTATEHGFAALWPAGGEAVGVAWLDGRATGGGGHAGHGGGGGAMTLRAALLDRDGKQAEWPLDDSTCDCCQTDVALAAAGTVLVYRDRAEGEVRDIAIVRQLGRGADAHWSEPALVHADGWFMPACPVNGPAVAARGDRVWVAWYTAAGDVPRVKLAQSSDGGASFGAPQVLAEGNDAQGRVDVQPATGGAWVSWVEEGEAGQSLRLAWVDAAGTASPPVTVAAIAARGRASGFPRMALLGGVLHLAWTDVVDGRPRLRGVRVRRD